MCHAWNCFPGTVGGGAPGREVGSTGGVTVRLQQSCTQTRPRGRPVARVGPVPSALWSVAVLSRACDSRGALLWRRLPAPPCPQVRGSPSAGAACSPGPTSQATWGRKGGLEVTVIPGAVPASRAGIVTEAGRPGGLHLVPEMRYHTPRVSPRCHSPGTQRVDGG